MAKHKRWGKGNPLWEWQHRNKSKSYTHKRGTKKMARHRRYHSRRSSRILGVGGAVVGAIAYGALRQKMSNALMPVTSKIPLGNISDEVGMYFALMLAKRYIGRKVPLVSQIASAGQYIELARIGETIANGQLNI